MYKVFDLDKHSCVVFLIAFVLSSTTGVVDSALSQQETTLHDGNLVVRTHIYDRILKKVFVNIENTRLLKPLSNSGRKGSEKFLILGEFGIVSGTDAGGKIIHYTEVVGRKFKKRNGESQEPPLELYLVAKLNSLFKHQDEAEDFFIGAMKMCPEIQISGDLIKGKIDFQGENSRKISIRSDIIMGMAFDNTLNQPILKLKIKNNLKKYFRTVSEADAALDQYATQHPNCSISGNWDRAMLITSDDHVSVQSMRVNISLISLFDNNLGRSITHVKIRKSLDKLFDTPEQAIAFMELWVKDREDTIFLGNFNDAFQHPVQLQVQRTDSTLYLFSDFSNSRIGDYSVNIVGNNIKQAIRELNAQYLYRRPETIRMRDKKEAETGGRRGRAERRSR